MAAVVPGRALAGEAAELPTDPVLARLIEQSLAARPGLAGLHAEARAERERVRQAGALPDPMLQVGVQNDAFDRWNVGKMETSWYTVMASQTFPGRGKRRLRGELAELSADRSLTSVARLRLSTEAEVRRAYLQLVLARERLELLLRLQAVWEKSAGIALARYEAGEGAQSDVLRAQLELSRIQQRRWALQVDIDTASQLLNRLRDHDLAELIEPGVQLEAWALPAARELKGATEDALARSPELAAVRLGAHQAERGRDLADKGYLPDLMVGAGVMPRGGAFPPMWVLNVGATIPVYAGARQSRAVAESAARATASQHDVTEVEQLLQLRTAQRRTALLATLEVIRLYREGLLVQSEATAESTLAQYEVGRVTFASVLEANAGFLADRDGYLQAIAQAQSLEIDAAEVSLAPVASTPSGAMEGSSLPGAASSRAMSTPSSAGASAASSM